MTRPSKQVTQHHPHRLQLQSRLLWPSQQSGKPGSVREHGCSRNQQASHPSQLQVHKLLTFHLQYDSHHTVCVCVRARVIVYTHLCQCLCEMKAVQLSLDQSSKIPVLCLVLVSSRFIIFSSGAQSLSLLTEHLRGNGNISKTPKICRHMVTPFYSCGPCRVQIAILIVIRTSLECLL